MTTLQQIGLECPVCENKFQTTQVVSTNCFGGKRTDFHERAAGTQPWPYLVHQCTKCFYAGPEIFFNGNTVVSSTAKEQVWEEIYPSFSHLELLQGSDKYNAAAKCALILGFDLRDIADMYLHASWCAVDERDVEAERYYRRHAAWNFEKALKSFDGIEGPERAVFTYLVGELWRRVGDLTQARKWFNEVPNQIVDEKAQEWILKASKKQGGENPGEWFG